MPKVDQIQLMVQDNAIHCVGCENRIETVLRKLSGVLRVKADHETQVISLALDPDKSSIAEVRQRLEIAGYETD